MAWPTNAYSTLTETVLTLWSGKIATTTVPVDAKYPPKNFTGSQAVGDGSTDINGDGQAPEVGSIRVDGWKQLSITVELYVSSGSGSATFRPYFWDGSRWTKCGDSIVYTSSITSSLATARERHDIYIEHDYGFCMVLEAISGTNATAACYATRKDPVLARK